MRYAASRTKAKEKLIKPDCCQLDSTPVVLIKKAKAIRIERVSILRKKDFFLIFFISLPCPGIC